jgi:hypothetical protein
MREYSQQVDAKQNEKSRILKTRDVFFTMFYTPRLLKLIISDSPSLLICGSEIFRKPEMF